MIKVEPTAEFPLPYDTSDEKPKTFHDELAIAANTADVLQELGATIDLSPEDLDKVKELTESRNRKKASVALRDPSTASAAAMFLKSYANQVATDVHEVRSAITAKLMEIANCGDPRYELKALELLGKHSDVGLFTERSEITVTHKNSDTLEAAIKERIKRLLNSDVVDVVPLTDTLDTELGVIELDGDVRSRKIVNEALDPVEETEEEQVEESDEGDDEPPN
jgi:hypothetical protein